MQRNNKCIIHILLLSFKVAIASAKSLEEVQQLEAMLKAGQLPGHVVANSNGQVVDGHEDEMEH